MPGSESGHGITRNHHVALVCFCRILAEASDHVVHAEAHVAPPDAVKGQWRHESIVVCELMYVLY